MKQYGALAMLYASHVIEGKRTIDTVPTSIRDVVEEIVQEAVGKKLEEQ